jgi:ATP-dependent Clp protease protease subunit
MLLNKHIGFDAEEGQGVDGSLFQEELLMLDSMGKKRIQVWINSPGGVVMDGYNIYSTILKTKTKVDTYCLGIAASIAAVIFQAGRNRIMADYSVLMYHNPYGGSDNEQLSKMRDSIATMVANRVGKEKDEVLRMMDKTTWIQPNEALATGLCDMVDNSAEHNKKRVVLSGEPMAMWRQGAEVLNSIFKQNDKTMYTKVTNKLGLMDGVSEDVVIEAINTIENKVKAQSESITELENSLKEKKAECEELENKLNEYKAKAEAAEAAEAKAKAEAETEKCKNMISEFAKAGRITNDEATINKWVETSNKLGFDETKGLIEALPLNKKAPEVVNTLKDGELPTTALSLMAKVKVKNKAKI